MRPEREPSEPAFVPSLCRIRPAVSSSTQLLELLATDALDAGYVRESFGRALLSREVAFPTGLPTATPVAIPHVDPEHVLRPGFVAATLDPPLAFREMGSTDRMVDVVLVVLLLVTDPAAQVTMLGRLIGLFQRPDLAETLHQLASPDDLAQTLSERWLAAS